MNARTVLRWVLSVVLKWTGILSLRELSLRGTLRILIFHRIHQTRLDDGMTVSASVFESQMAHLRAHYTVVSLDATCAMLTGQTSVPANAVAVTFDDGYEANYTLAQPILNRHGITATFFLAVGALEGGIRLWPEELRLALWGFQAHALSLEYCGWGTWPVRTDRERYACLSYIRDKLKTLSEAEQAQAVEEILRRLGRSADESNTTPMCTWDQVREMHKAGMTIGAHTVTHKILTKIDVEDAQWEVAESKRRIERELGETIEHFAYPNGTTFDWNPHIRNLVRTSGFQTASTTMRGTNPVGSDVFALRRIEINDSGCLNPFGRFSPAVFDARFSGLLGGWESTCR